MPGKEEIDAAAVAARAAERGIAVQGRKREWGAKRPSGEADEGVQDEEEGVNEEEREARRIQRTRQAIEDARQAEAEIDGAADGSAGKRRKRKPHSALEAVTDAPPAAVKARQTQKTVAETAPEKPAEPEVKKRKRKPHSASAAGPAKDAKWREKQASKPVITAAPAEEPTAAMVEGEPAEKEKSKRKRKPRGASPTPDEAGAAPPKAAEKTSVLKVVEVKPARRGKKAGKASSGGLDLEQAFKQPAASVETADAGGGAFGTGGWDD